MVTRVGLRIALAVFALAVASTGWSASEVALHYYRNFEADKEVASLRNNLAEQEHALASEAKPLGRLRAALQRQRLFAETVPVPWDVLQHLGQGLEGLARVTSFDWHDDDTLHLVLRLDVAQDADPEQSAGRFKNITEKLAQALPTYTLDVTRYPFPVLPQGALTNAGDAAQAVPEAPTAELFLRRRL